MAMVEEFPTLTSDDEQARRLCALAIAFSNAELPISSTDVHAAHYPDLSDDSFRRKFSRDREKLVECGLVIRQVGSDANAALWQADASSFADASSISAEDALMLDVLGTQLVADPSFAYRGELRLALAKVDHAFGTLTAARLAPSTSQATDSLAVLLSCMGEGRVARIDYVDARGNRGSRLVAPYGHFGLRGHVYFVCAQADGGKVDPQHLRTLRTDRMGRVSKTSRAFLVPEDFSVEDHVLLPFQIGPSVCTVVLAQTDGTDPDMLAALRERSHALPGGTHQTSASSIDAAATWAIAADMRPQEPQELVDAWQQKLAAAQLIDERPLPARPRGASPRSARRRAGRRGAVDETRELVALVGSLASEGATLTPTVVAARLGTTVERARLLISLVLTACTGTDYHLPLALSADDGVVLSRSKGVSGRPVRLTRTETHALVAALDELGFSADDPLREDVLSAFAPKGLVEGDVRPRVEAALSRAKSETLEACSRAICAGVDLAFGYQRPDQSAPSARRAGPVALRRSGDFWYVDAFDLDRQGMRAFRVDRMSDVRVRQRSGRPRMSAGERRAERAVEVAFLDDGPLDALEWPRLEVVAQSGGVTFATIPYYGGSWLPRRIAACGSAVATDDEEMRILVRAEATRALGQPANPPAR